VGRKGDGEAGEVDGEKREEGGRHIPNTTEKTVRNGANSGRSLGATWVATLNHQRKCEKEKISLNLTTVAG